MPSARRPRWSTAFSTACAGSVSIGTKGRTSAARTGRTSSRSGSIVIARWPTRLVAKGRAYYCYCTPEELKARREAAEKATGGVEIRSHLLRADRRMRSRCATSATAPRAIRFRVPAGHRPASTISCTGRSSSTTRTSKTSSSCAPTASRPITSPSSPTTSRWRSRTWSAATITSRTRRSRCCSTRRSDAAAAAVRARAADPRAGQEAAEQTSRRDVGDRIRAAGISAGGDGQFSRAARLVARRRSRDLHARRARRGRSHSKASAAATRSSIPKSSTGSTSSTSCGCRPTSSPAREAVVRSGGHLGRRRSLGDRHAWFFAVLELLQPAREAARRFRAAGPILFRGRPIDYDAAAVDKHLRVSGMDEHICGASTPRSRALDSLRRRCRSRRRCAPRLTRGV